MVVVDDVGGVAVVDGTVVVADLALVDGGGARVVEGADGPGVDEPPPNMDDSEVDPRSLLPHMAETGEFAPSSMSVMTAMETANTTRALTATALQRIGTRRARSAHLPGPVPEPPGPVPEPLGPVPEPPPWPAVRTWGPAEPPVPVDPPLSVEPTLLTVRLLSPDPASPRDPLRTEEYWFRAGLTLSLTQPWVEEM